MARHSPPLASSRRASAWAQHRRRPLKATQTSRTSRSRGSSTTRPVAAPTSAAATSSSRERRETAAPRVSGPRRTASTRHRKAT
ncbi:hypothetical protein ACFPRL_07035 [Pseudoclavibacter helvolus]